MNLIEHIYRQREFSKKTFGADVKDPDRFAGVIDHIRKELLEIEENALDLEEWIDVIILAIDGAWRTGATPEEIADMLQFKQNKNEVRKWPDWRTSEPGKAIEHIRD